ncbi:oligosaccharide flippase family protein [Pseudoalteromonas agarivorans]|uniref:oligosaccharide flippase family protein n=1 Tax=Pseudoalteromonas agarivorans TaxID=176102 RepID=UPI0003D5CFBF|nr:oligosaccharide flippase family protein [Pseudoalteromonas agarivorans]ETJ48376.1 hypothetical protein X564_09605 [Pseudoalteromonas agarivorans]
MSFFKSALWIFFDKVFLVLLSTFSFFVFAIYLQPEEMGKGVIFIAVPGLIAGLFSGMIESPLVSKKSVIQEEYSTVLWFSVGLSFLLFTFTMFVGLYFLDDASDLLMLAISLSTVIYILAGRPFLAKLRREHNFKSIALRALLAKCIGFVVGVTLAVKGFGAYAIIMQYVLQELISLLVMAYFMKDIIKLTFRKELLINTLKMGRYLSISAFSNSLINNGLPLVLGSVSGAASVGLFNFSNRIVSLPREAVFNGINTYALPSLSKIQNDKSLLEKRFSKSNRFASFLVFPLFFGLAAIAPLLINTLFSEKWAESIVYLQSLALIAVFRTFYLFHGSLFLILKVPNIITRKELLSSITSLMIIIVLGGEFGAAAGVIAIGVYTFLSFLWNVLAVNKVITYKFNQFLKDFTPALIMSITMGLVVYFLSNSNFIVNQNLKLILCIFVGVIVYAGMLCIVEKGNVRKIYRARFCNEKNNIVSPK